MTLRAAANLDSKAILENAKKTIWLTRTDVRQVCDGDFEQFECWLAINGRHEYAIFDTAAALSPDLLSRRSRLSHPDVRPALTFFLEHLWRCRADVQQAFPLNSLEGQQGYLWWYFFHGISEFGLIHLLTDEQRAFLTEPDPSLEQSAAYPISRLMAELWRRRGDLQSAFALSTPEGRAGFFAWTLHDGRQVPGLGDLLDAIERPGHARPSASSLSSPSSPAGAEAPRSGVNLIGFARGEFGIGEDVRMAALSLQAAGIPFALHNVDTDPEVSQNDRRMEGMFTDTLPYSVNLFCMTGFDMAGLVARKGPAMLAGRYNIGLWPWELPEWPNDWHHAYDLVDEVWAASRYTYDAFVKSCPKPVRHVPAAVTVDLTEGQGRASFGLPENRFLFVFAFDCLSWLTRKNPMACLEAFRMAFPHGHELVGLVIKVMRPNPKNPVWQTLLAEAARDPRITLLTETFTRGKLLDLYRACDCFMSLHRAEGFGRNIAEAMMLGKPVIVTGYSGNLDFTTTGTAALVGYRQAKVGAGDYPFAEAQIWAEPDVGHAAWWMQRIAAGPELRQELATRGQAIVAGIYAPKAVGKEYQSLLPLQ